MPGNTSKRYLTTLYHVRVEAGNIGIWGVASVLTGPHAKEDQPEPMTQKQRSK